MFVKCAVDPTGVLAGDRRGDVGRGDAVLPALPRSDTPDRAIGTGLDALQGFGRGREDHL